MEPSEPAAIAAIEAAAQRAWRRRHPVLAELVKSLAVAATILAVGTGVVWGVAVWTAVGNPSCSWPLRTRGTVSAAQVNAVRCYLQGLAHNDGGAMMAVADYDPPVRLTRADFAHAADARAGLATALFTPNPEDTTSATVTITFADGTRTSVWMINMIAMGGPSIWRLQIGTGVNPSTGPPPAIIQSPMPQVPGAELRPARAAQPRHLATAPDSMFELSGAQLGLTRVSRWW